MTQKELYTLLMSGGQVNSRQVENLFNILNNFKRKGIKYSTTLAGSGHFKTYYFSEIDKAINEQNKIEP